MIYIFAYFTSNVKRGSKRGQLVIVDFSISRKKVLDNFTVATLSLVSIVEGSMK